MDTIKGVITGDIIDSTQIEAKDRELLLTTLRNIVNDAERWSEIRLEIFRGDSFQLIVNNPIEALRVAIFIRVGLQKSSPTSTKWDARIALGIGAITFDQERSVIESDGEAFRNSGREFDELGKSKRLAIKTPWEEFNREFKVNTTFADELISSWTILQAQAIYLSLLTEKTQKELATELDKSPQAFSKLMIGAKVYLIDLYLKRYEEVMTTKMNTCHGMDKH